MYAAKKPEAMLVKCAACGTAPALAGFWGTYLCEVCNAAWFDERGFMWELEQSHANAHPEDVEYRGQKQFPCSQSPTNEVLILKHGVVERITRDFALSWLEARRSKPQKRSA